MKKKIFTLLTLLVACVTGAWADTETIFSYTVTAADLESMSSITPPILDGKDASGTIGGTCAFYIQATSGNYGYYRTASNSPAYNFGGGNNHIKLTLASGTFKKDDVVSVTFSTNSSGNARGYYVRKTTYSNTTDQLTSETSSTAKDTKSVTLTTAFDGETDIYINRNGGISVFTVTVQREVASNTEPYTVTFDAGTNGTCATTSLTEASANAGVTLPAVSPKSGYVFNGWYDATSGGTKIGNAGATYKPTGDITLYAQYTAQVAPKISIDNKTQSTPRGNAITFTATATGTPAPTVTWYQSATDTNSGGTEKGTGETYKPDVTTVGTYYFYAVASNGVSSDATSDVITLTVTDPDVNRSGYNTFYIAKGDQPVPGERILCDDITMTFVNGKDGESFTAAIDDNSVSAFNTNFVASISGSSSNNGWKTKFVPTKDGQLSVGVVINANKTFSITPESNVTSFTYLGRNNAATPVNVSAKITGYSFTTASGDANKLYVIVTLWVEKDKEYSLSVAGSKMGFYGFEFTPDAVPVSIGSYGWATFVSPFVALDFEGAEVKAYTVTGRSDKAITLSSELTEVPANTPLLLKGSVGTYNIPVIASASSVGTNLLQLGTGAEVSDEENITRYVLGVEGGKATFLKIDAVAATVPVGKAYLEFAEDIAAPTLSFDFGNSTGINTVNGSELKVNGEYYNLAGQRVANPTKGLYIVNGKKVIVK